MKEKNEIAADMLEVTGMLQVFLQIWIQKSVRSSHSCFFSSYSLSRVSAEELDLNKEINTACSSRFVKVKV